MYGTTDYKSQAWGKSGKGDNRATEEDTDYMEPSPLHGTARKWAQSYSLARVAKTYYPRTCSFQVRVKKFLLILQQIFMAFLLYAGTVLGGVNKTNAIPVI